MTEAAATPRAMRLKIHGRVQGVFFRDSMRREAERLEVAGWVRNCSDGTVEAFLQGDEAGISAIVHWAHSGPPNARVSQVELDEAEPQAVNGFEIRYR